MRKMLPTRLFALSSMTSVVLLLACLACWLTTVSTLLSSLLSRPTRTPILVLAGSYDYQWDLNPWSAEDQARVESLGNQVFNVRQLGNPNELANGIWDDAVENIRQSLAECDLQQPCVLYINLHGAVDDQGRPCLLPPNASLVDTSSWLPLEDLLSCFEQSQPAEPRSVLLLLESGRLQNWPAAGIADNTFDSHLGQLIDDANRQHPQWSVAAISSASIGQRSKAIHSSRLGIGSIFTRYAVDGLSGAADGFSSSHRKDGWVDIDELYQYTRLHVQNCSTHYTSMPQTPTLHASDRGVKSRIALATTTLPTAVALSVEPPTREETLQWHATVASINKLGESRFQQLDPLAWSQLARRCQTLAESLFGGTAVRSTFAVHQHNLNSLINNYQNQLANYSNSAAQSPSHQAVNASLSAWQAIAKSPKWETADLQLTVPEVAFALPGLQNLTKHRELDFWKNQKWIQSIADSEAQWYQCAAVLPLGCADIFHQENSRVSARRRELLDLLLAYSESTNSIHSNEESTATLAQVESALHHLANQVDHSTLRTSTVSNAYLLLQNFSWQIPYLCNWADGLTSAISPVNESLSTPFDNAAPAISCRKLIQQGSELESLLVASFTVYLTDQQIGHLAGLTQQMERSLAALKNELAHQIDNAIAQHSTPTSFTLAILANCPHVNPLLIGTTRFQNAMEALTTVENTSHNANTLTESTNTLPESRISIESTSVQEFLAHLAQTQQPQPTAVTNSLTESSNDCLGSTYRKLILNLVAEIHQADASEWNEETTLQKIHFQSCLIPGSSSDFVKRWVARHGARHSCTLAEMTLDDFWLEPTYAGKFPFSHLTSAFLGEAESLEISCRYLQHTRQSLQRLLNERTVAAENGIAFQVSPTPSLENNSVSEVQFSSAFQSTHSFPPGLGVLRTRPRSHLNASNLSNESEQPQFVSAPIPISENEAINVLCEIPTPLLTHDCHELQFYFRGHAMPVSLPEGNYGLRKTTTVRDAPTPAKVTLSAGAAQRRSVMFVLDCSASMERLSDLESPQIAIDSNSTTSQATLLDAARVALTAMLAQIGDPDTQVGLMAYGHRVATDRKGENTLIQKKYHSAFPFDPTLQPYADVETILPVGRFGALERSSIQQHFDQLVPWGQTPLFMSIVRGVQELANIHDEDDRDLIIITDGKNYQFNPCADADISIDQAIETALRHKVRVHMIGFGVPEAEAATSQKEFQRISSETGGKYVAEVRKASDLLANLNNLVSTSRTFTISTESETKTASLNSTITLSTDVAENSWVSLEYNGTQTWINVSPGVHLQLATDPFGNSVRSERFTNGLMDKTPLISTNGKQVAAFAAVVTPNSSPRSPSCPSMANSNSQTVSIAFQRSDLMTSDRPAFVWYEVSPQSSIEVSPQSSLLNTPNAKNAQPIYFSGDANWLTGMPVPVAQFDCHHWPDNCEKGAITLWCSTTLEQATDSLSLEPSNNHWTRSIAVDQSEYEIRFTLEKNKLSAYIELQGNTPDVNMSESLNPIWLRCVENVVTETSAWHSPDRHVSLYSFTLTPDALDRWQVHPLEFQIVDLKKFKAQAVTTERPLIMPMLTSQPQSVASEPLPVRR